MLFKKWTLALGVIPVCLLTSCIAENKELTGTPTAPETSTAITSTQTSTATTTDTATTENTPPSIISVNASATYITGFASDVEGGQLSYSWSIDGIEIGSGQLVLLESVTGVSGLQTVTLTVSDGTDVTTKELDVDFGVLIIAPVNVAPVIHSILVSDTHITPFASDENDDELFYFWSIVGTTIETNKILTLADVSDEFTGENIVTLTVFDGVLFDTDEVTVQFAPAEPEIDLNNPAIKLLSQYDGDIQLIEKGLAGVELQTINNPFSNSNMYVNYQMSNSIDYSIENTSDTPLINKMKYIKQQPTAIWLNSIDDITGEIYTPPFGLTDHLDAALLQQQYLQTLDIDKIIAPMTIVLGIYNMPDRDCTAYIPNGKLIQVGQDQSAYSEGVQGFGYAKYRDEYIKPIAQILSDDKYKSLRIVTILEPNSFVNMIINTNEAYHTTDSPFNPFPAALDSNGYCDEILNFNNETIMPAVVGEGNTNNPNLGLYAGALRLAIKEIHDVSLINNNIYTYLDIGQANLLGQDAANDVTEEYYGYEHPEYKDGIPDYLQSTMKRSVRYFKQLIDGADGKLDGEGLDWIRGFASNIRGYTPTEEPLISNSMTYLDSKELEAFYEYNPSVDEMTYIDYLNTYFTTADLTGYFGTQKFEDIGFIIDTSRNGWGELGDSRPKPGEGVKGVNPDKRVDTRTHRNHWCNVNNAGIGETPKADPDSTREHLDAFYWMTTPGSSDGISFHVNDFHIGTSSYDRLDSVEKDVVMQAFYSPLNRRFFDPMCIPGENIEGKMTNVVPEMAPHKGVWFHKQFIMLIENAYPKLGESDYE
ncbi:MAG: glycoside hydrolase family 6 protein [Saccharospirillaceae bacterium]|nr:glycoside hydrolase family 6 protein [Pseudomonadales bacterium]NRB79098.1 glycoside hydrolase family 6 protein [Saccharospirillaceae bacterium]